MLIKKTFYILIIVFLINISNLKASTKSEIIKSINNIETLQFNFQQVVFDKKENGNCFLKRPHFLKCIYKDKNEKQIIVNKKNLVIYHKKLRKIYYYPVSKSFFSDIFDKKKFENLILQGNLSNSNSVIKVEFFSKTKGQIIFLFNERNLDLSGWEIKDINGNYTSFVIDDLIINQELDKKLFKIPEIM